jgi:RNA polymerase sigma-70 factor (ECF subfamily)
MKALDPQSLPRHVDRLYRAAWALCGSREDAEDLVQETFARVLARPRVIRGEDELYYLMRALRNTYLTSRRSAARRPVTAASLEDVIVADPRVTDRPAEAVEVKELYATIAELPPDFRLALVAVDVLGLSYREAARALKVREATITTRLFRARGQVARRLESEGQASGAARTPSALDAERAEGAAEAPAGTPARPTDGGPTRPQDDAAARPGQLAHGARPAREDNRPQGVLEGRRTP